MPVSASDLQNIRNGIAHILTACGPYSASEVSACDFGILTDTSGCAVLFMPGTANFAPLAFGGQVSRHDNRMWGVSGQIWVKDLADNLAFNGRVWQAPDDFYHTIQKDNTLNGTCKNARVTQIAYAADGEDKAGQHWGVLSWTIIAEMFG